MSRPSRPSPQPPSCFLILAERCNKLKSLAHGGPPQQHSQRVTSWSPKRYCTNDVIVTFGNTRNGARFMNLNWHAFSLSIVTSGHTFIDPLVEGGELTRSRHSSAHAPTRACSQSVSSSSGSTRSAVARSVRHSVPTFPTSGGHWRRRACSRHGLI
ncbi:hypothetical protein H4582DRAFT_1956915 [Lactarius indigo]|nr:hypothetical protein H4582DRAFT_1956915 [Lactarius indigo]